MTDQKKSDQKIYKSLNKLTYPNQKIHWGEETPNVFSHSKTLTLKMVYINLTGYSGFSYITNN